MFLAAAVPGVSRSKVKSWLEAGVVALNGRPAKPRDQIKAGDVVAYRRPRPVPSPLAPVALPLDILFEDEHLVVVNKPAGLSVHPGAGTQEATLVQALLHHAGKLSRAAEARGEDPDAWLRPGIVHRLDKDTSGVIVVAKTDEAHAHLAQQFHDKTNLREYVALLDGLMQQDEILHESYLYRDPSSRLKFASLSREGHAEIVAKYAAEPGQLKRYRHAKSLFRKERTFGERLTLARVRLYTGRTHQIRVHALDLRLPIVGDLVYHRQTLLPQSFPPEVRQLVAAASRQMLHAAVLGFMHPATGQKLRFDAPYPVDLNALITALAAVLQS